MKSNQILPILFACALLGCSKKEENPAPNEENELITTVILHVTPPGGTMVNAQWKDLTPDEPSGRTIDTLRLADSTTYSGYIELFDDSKSPADNITTEVKTEATDHLFVYKTIAPLTTDQLSVTRTDKDANNREVGLTFSLKTGATGMGSLQVILRHQPGVKDGTEAPGDSDVDITIPVKIQ